MRPAAETSFSAVSSEERYRSSWSVAQERSALHEVPGARGRLAGDIEKVGRQRRQ